MKYGFWCWQQFFKTRKILISREGSTDNINNSAVDQEIFSFHCTKPKTKFCLSLNYNGDETYFHVITTRISKFKGLGNIPAYQFCLGCVSKDFTKDESIDISWNNAAYIF